MPRKKKALPTPIVLTVEDMSPRLTLNARRALWAQHRINPLAIAQACALKDEKGVPVLDDDGDQQLDMSAPEFVDFIQYVIWGKLRHDGFTWEECGEVDENDIEFPQDGDSEE